ncbi:bacteriocin fulvocin C-related protein [Draconibacterium sp. IB214405]|uniref:bacteriocin fulvocin C-related protein n=1 Tax=Draconibacterium sp. IB214405 TaxID=3097352 RepID=UPI002A0E9AB7|nr:bacteriocin fulvocin C-related protein [Draconibacterium sp. IB214405]MDX8339754.1 bacteriocin fulvocin C-related protein [Draconibacterium sp. IB214405]
MKKIFFLLGILTIFYACSDEDIIYSCDPDVDAIVKFGEINTAEITLVEFLEYDLTMQKALFRSFSIEKQKAFWLEKLDSVMVNEIETQLEFNHVDSLKTFLNDNYGVVEPVLQQTFENQWINYARDTLLWEDQKIYFIISSLCIYEEQYELLMQVQTSTRYIQSDCGCSTSSDYCYQQGGTCMGEGGCATVEGCGWLWQYDCNGGCG